MTTPETTTPTPPQAAPGMTVIENVQLEEIEKAVYHRDYERASQLVLAALRKIKQGGEFVGYSTDHRLKQVLYSRLAAAILSLVMDPKFALSQEGFDHFASEHAMTDIVFRASVFETSDHALASAASNTTEMDKAKLQFSNGSALVKFLLTYSMRSAFGLNFGQTFSRSPQMLFSLWAGMISPLLTTAQAAFDRREELLGLHGLFADVEVTDPVLPTLSDAYMYASYGVRPDKHDLKRTVHAIMARALRKRKVQVPSAESLAQRRRMALADPSRRPTILVCLEWFSGHHAMYRCYAPIIRQLRQRFRLVAMARERDVDAVGIGEFDEFIPVPVDHLQLGVIVDSINRVAPDIIYYPSLGMAMWWVMLASVRLAPIQVMTLGHPSSSRSPAMDYVICEDGAIGDPALFSERIVQIPYGSARFVMRPDAVMPAITRDDRPDTVQIAVPAMLCKLNAPFMQALRRIRDGVGRPVQFHFFINMMGANLYQAAREIREWLPESRVYERSNYATYMEHLAACHLHLCTFPFGGTNSNIDSMLLGIPIMTREGMEPHERFDAMMARRAGQPAFTVASTTDAYVQAAIDLISSDELRNSVRDGLRAADLQGLFFGDPEPALQGAFLRAMSTIYDGHEEWQSLPDDQRVIVTRGGPILAL